MSAPDDRPTPRTSFRVVFNLIALYAWIGTLVLIINHMAKRIEVLENHVTTPPASAEKDTR